MKLTYKWHLKETPSITFPNFKWGAWGGGWDYKLGLQVSKTEVMFMLLVVAIHLYWGQDES